MHLYVIRQSAQAGHRYVDRQNAQVATRYPSEHKEQCLREYCTSIMLLTLICALRLTSDYATSNGQLSI
jgi:hypothetical protein